MTNSQDKQILPSYYRRSGKSLEIEVKKILQKVRKLLGEAR